MLVVCKQCNDANKENIKLLGFIILIILQIQRQSTMNQKYYPIDFEAQYEETSEKMIEISQTYKEIILTKQPQQMDKLELNLQAIQMEIEEKGLQFHKQSIYSQFASGQLMAERRKQPPEMCPECGQQLKKQVQCQFCAEIFCKKCCSRNRIIPFVSKDIHLCCEQCHWKFVKLFDNKQFYEEKQKLINVINFIRNKTNKVMEKVNSKRKEVEQIKKEKLNQKIKQKANESKLQQEQKKLKQLEEQFRRVVAEKAQKIKEQDNRRRQEEIQKKKLLEVQANRKRQQEEQKRKKAIEQQEQRKEQQARKERQKFNSQLRKRQQEIKREKQKLQLQLLKKKQQQVRKKDEEIMQLRRQLQKQKTQQKKRKNSTNSTNSKTNQKKNQVAKQLVPDNIVVDQNPIVNGAKKQSTKDKSRKASQEINQKIQLPKLQSYKSSQDEKRSSVRLQSQPPKKIQSQEKLKQQNPDAQDTLERSLANMFKVKKQQKKDQDTRSLASNNSKAKSIMDMSVNELLAMRVPSTKSAVPRSSSRIDTAETKQSHQIPETILETVEKSSSELFSQIQETYITPKKVTIDRSSIKQVIEEPQVNQSEIKIHRDSILRNSSLISSTNKDGGPELTTDAPDKCSCEIM